MLELPADRAASEGRAADRAGVGGAVRAAPGGKGERACVCWRRGLTGELSGYVCAGARLALSVLMSCLTPRLRLRGRAALALAVWLLGALVAWPGGGGALASRGARRAVAVGSHPGVAVVARRRRTRRRPGCGAFCRQAGALGGGGERGASGPLCPPYPCTMIKILTRRSKLTRGGLVRVRLQCLWSRPCVGAFVIYSTRNLGATGRYGGGDFVVSANRTGTATVPLLARARRLVRRRGRVESGAFVHLKGFGGEKLAAGGGPLTIQR